MRSLAPKIAFAALELAPDIKKYLNRWRMAVSLQRPRTTDFDRQQVSNYYRCGYNNRGFFRPHYAIE